MLSFLDRLLGRREDVKKSQPIYTYNQGDAHTLELEAATLYSTHNINDAINMVENGIRQYPNSAYLYYIRGLIKEDKGDFKTGIYDFSKFLERKEDDCNGLFKMGLCNQKLNFSTKAIEFYDKSIIHFSKNASDTTLAPHLKLHLPLEVIYTNKGTCKANIGDNENAMVDADKAIELNKNYPDAHFLKGNLWAKLGNREQAIAALIQSADLGFQPAKSQLGRMGLDNKGITKNAV
jgi:tetratricopeptide (TPR) repeat protein